MRYVAILAGFLILAGAGCGTTPSSTDVSQNQTSNTSGQSSEGNTLDNKSAQAGFRVYVPTFAPTDAPVEGEAAVTTNKAGWILSKDSFNTELPLITIEENPAGAAGGVTEKLLPKLTSQETITVNGASGYYGIQNNIYDYNTVIFTTADGVEIGIWSRSYGKDVLMQVAQGMK